MKKTKTNFFDEFLFLQLSATDLKLNHLININTKLNNPIL